jgi:hypothetical protein
VSSASGGIVTLALLRPDPMIPEPFDQWRVAFLARNEREPTQDEWQRYLDLIACANDLLALTDRLLLKVAAARAGLHGAKAS